MSSGGDNANVSVICDTDGIVRFEATTRAGNDDWSSGEQAAPNVGKPLIKTYWFDHLDCDHRELQQILRKAAGGEADRVRVWLRVDEHQLIRAELTATPLADESGQACNVLVRTEASSANRRRRDASEPETKPVRTAEPPTAAPAALDPLELRLSVPMLRLALDGGTILGVNDAFADLIDRPRNECINQPMSELTHEPDRRALIETLAAAKGDSDAPRSAEVRLTATGGREIHVRLTITPDPTAAPGIALIVARDHSAEMMTQQLLKRADELTSVWMRKSERLQQLESFFDRAPIGLALFDQDKLVRSNAAFDARHSTIQPEIERVRSSVAIQKGAADATSKIASPIQSYHLGDSADSPLAIVLSAASENGAASHSALEAAIEQTGNLAAARVTAGDALAPVGTSLAALLRQEVPSHLAGLFADPSLAEVRDAVHAMRAATTPADAPKTLDAALVDGRRVAVTLSPQPDKSVLMLLVDSSEHLAQIDQLGLLLQQRSEQIDELRARASSIDPGELNAALGLAMEKQTQIGSILGALSAGAFTWDINSGAIQADARAVELLACGSETPTSSTLLAAATLDERRAFEHSFFDAVSTGGRIDLTVHIGPERRPIRIVGDVFVEERDDARDPRTLSATVFDLGDTRASQTRVSELEHQLALRTAELNAILESSRDSIRIVTAGTLRQNDVASERFGEGARHGVTGAKGASSASDERSGTDETSNGVLTSADDDRTVSAAAVQTSTAPILLNGESVGHVTIDIDLSDQQQLEQQLQQRDTQLREREQEIAAFFGNTGVGVMHLDQDRAVVKVNAAICSLLGFTPEDLTGRPITAIASADDLSTLTGQFDALTSGELQSCTSELRLMRRDGSPRWVQLTVSARHGTTDRSLYLLAQDVQELRELAEARSVLQRDADTARARHAALLATMDDASMRLNADGIVIEANGVAQTMFDLGKHTSLEHNTFIAPETGHVIDGPLPWTRAAAGKPVVVELRIERPHGETIVGRFNAQAQENGDILLQVKDVTEVYALQEELQKAQARIVETQTHLQNRTKLLEGNYVSAVQQLGASIQSAYGSAKALRDDARLPKPLHELGKRVVDAFRVHRRLVQHYTASAMTGAAATSEQVDVHELAREAVRSLTERFNITGRLELQLDAQQSVCRLDGALVRHALWSLFAHAASQATKLPAKARSTSLLLTDGTGRFRIDIEWPGTRDNTGELLLARALIESCGGNIAFAPGAGSTRVSIEFDLDRPETDDSKPRDDSPLNLLLIEDHESTARVLRRQLERLNCKVTLAGNLEDAQAFLNNGSDTQLIVCDLTLPEGDAVTFIGDLSRKLDLPAIALRSYGGVEDPQELRDAGFVDHLDKPVDLNALSAAIQKIAASR